MAGCVGILAVDLHFPNAHSLKEKRRELRRIEAGLVALGCAVSECEHHDLWQRSGLVIAVAADSPGSATRRLDRVSRRLASDPIALLSGEGRDLCPAPEQKLWTGPDEC